MSTGEKDLPVLDMVQNRKGVYVYPNTRRLKLWGKIIRRTVFWAIVLGAVGSAFGWF